MLDLLVLALFYGFPVFLIYMIFTVDSKKQNLNVRYHNYPLKTQYHRQYYQSRQSLDDRRSQERLKWLLSVWTDKPQKNK